MPGPTIIYWYGWVGKDIVVQASSAAGYPTNNDPLYGSLVKNTNFMKMGTTLGQAGRADSYQQYSNNYYYNNIDTTQKSKLKSVIKRSEVYNVSKPIYIVLSIGVVPTSIGTNFNANGGAVSITNITDNDYTLKEFDIVTKNSNSVLDVGCPSMYPYYMGNLDLSALWLE